MINNFSEIHKCSMWKILKCVYRAVSPSTLTHDSATDAASICVYVYDCFNLQNLWIIVQAQLCIRSHKREIGSYICSLYSTWYKLSVVCQEYSFSSKKIVLCQIAEKYMSCLLYIAQLRFLWISFLYTSLTLLSELRKSRTKLWKGN